MLLRRGTIPKGICRGYSYLPTDGYLLALVNPKIAVQLSRLLKPLGSEVLLVLRVV